MKSTGKNGREASRRRPVGFNMKLRVEARVRVIQIQRILMDKVGPEVDTASEAGETHVSRGVHSMPASGVKGSRDELETEAKKGS